jgi:hypothetical protein
MSIVLAAEESTEVQTLRLLANSIHLCGTDRLELGSPRAA